jgi:hypothetical protein
MAEIALGDPNTVIEALPNFRERLKASRTGIVFGIIIFLGAFPLLFWNELRAVRRYDILEEGNLATVSVSPLVIDEKNDGKLVHFTATTSGVSNAASVSDSFFGIGCSGGVDCIALQRHSEMYQWKEEATTTLGSKETVTNYTYTQAWSGFLYNSDSFYNKSELYKNPTSFDFPSEDFVANPMMAGAFVLPSKIVNWVVVDRDPIDVSVIDIKDQSLSSRATATTSTTRGNGFYFGTGTNKSPELGDERVWFSQTPPSNITVVGVQRGGTIEAFTREDGKGGNVLLYERGNLTATRMFDIAVQDNRILTIILRFVGLAMMAVGLITILNPFKVLADPVPILGDIVGCGVNFISITIACVVGAITISIAWLIAHPLIGVIILVSCLVVIGGCAFGVKMCMNRKQKSEADDDNDEENN